MNFKGFKKVSSDKKSTKLIHEQGHELKIAHSALSPMLRKELDKLPAHEDAMKMAEGGEAEQDQSQKQPTIIINNGPQQPQEQKAYPVQEVPEEKPDYKTGYQYTPEDQAYLQKKGMNAPGQGPSPASVPQAAPEPQAQAPAPAEQAAPVTNTLAPATAEPQAPAQEQSLAPQEAAPAQSEQAPQVQEQQPEQGDQYQKSFDEYKQEHQKEFAQEDAAFQHDLQNGHVTPQTYHDLFAKKDTLGKIGTIFGLMLSGAGSGLSGQSNAMLKMMDQQIKNDLDAQMQSKGNAQNFIKLNQQQQMQNATIEQMKKTGAVTDAQAKAMTADAQLKAFTMARIQANSAALHNQSLMVQKMPEGPQKEQAKSLLAMMGAAVNAENANIGDVAASKLALMSTLGSGNTTGLRVMGMDKLADDVESKMVPGLPGKAKIPLTANDREAINGGVQFDQKLRRFIDWTKKHSGDINPSDRNTGIAMAAELQGAYRQATHGGVYKEGEQNFISKLIDSEPTKFFNSIRVLPQLNAIANENHSRLNQILESKGLPSYKPQGSSASSMEGKTASDGKGNKLIMKNGKWVPYGR